MIFDEMTFAENMNKSGFQQRMCLFELSIYAKWLKYNGKKPKQIKSELLVYCKKYNENFNEILHEGLLKRAIYETQKNRLRVPIDIGITINELDVINSLPNEKYKKAMFVILVVAKYFGLNNVKIYTKKELEKLASRKDNIKHFYYNSKVTDALKMAKIQILKRERIEMIHYYVREGYLKSTNYGTLEVPFVDVDGEAVFKIRDYDNIIFYYDYYSGNKRIEFCEYCGAPFKQSKTKPSKYCSKHRGYQKIESKILNCVDCGVEFEANSKTNKKTRCDVCQYNYIKKYDRQRKRH